jgi:hypothetical protein
VWQNLCKIKELVRWRVNEVNASVHWERSTRPVPLRGRRQEEFMSKSAPPVPPANRSDKGPGEDKTNAGGKVGDVQGKPDPDHKGQQANTKQNTTHQGYQQDR